MKRINVSFMNVYLHILPNSPIGGSNADYFFEGDSTPIPISEHNYTKNEDNEGKFVIRITRGTSIQVSRLFLDRKSIIARKAVEFSKLEKKNRDSSQLSFSVIQHNEIDNYDDKNYIKSLHSQYKSIVLSLYSIHVYRSFVWWYEVLIPILFSLFVIGFLYVT